MTRYERIKKLCKQQGHTITGLEKELGFSRGSLCKIDTSNPNSEKLMLLAKKLNTTPNYIMSGAVDEEPIDVGVEIQKLINYLTDDNSSYCYGEVLSEEGKLALLNSLKQDKEFLTALTNKDK